MRVTIRDKNSVNMLDMSLAGPTLALEETMKHIMGSVVLCLMMDGGQAGVSAHSVPDHQQGQITWAPPP